MECANCSVPLDCCPNCGELEFCKNCNQCWACGQKADILQFKVKPKPSEVSISYAQIDFVIDSLQRRGYHIVRGSDLTKPLHSSDVKKLFTLTGR